MGLNAEDWAVSWACWEFWGNKAWRLKGSGKATKKDLSWTLKSREGLGGRRRGEGCFQHQEGSKETGIFKGEGSSGKARSGNSVITFLPCCACGLQVTCFIFTTTLWCRYWYYTHFGTERLSQLSTVTRLVSEGQEQCESTGQEAAMSQWCRDRGSGNQTREEDRHILEDLGFCDLMDDTRREIAETEIGLGGVTPEWLLDNRRQWNRGMGSVWVWLFPPLNESLGLQKKGGGEGEKRNKTVTNKVHCTW